MSQATTAKRYTFRAPVEVVSIINKAVDTKGRRVTTESKIINELIRQGGKALGLLGKRELNAMGE